MQDIRNASNEMENLQQMLRDMHEDTLTRDEEIAESRQRDARAHSELALSLQSSLDSLVQSDMGRLFQSVAGFDASLVRDHMSMLA